MNIINEIINRISEIGEMNVNEEGFSDIKGCQSKSVAFVDGSNVELLNSADFSLQFIRVGYVVYTGNKRVSRGKKEFYVLVSVDGKEYVADSFADKKGVMRFSINDKELRVGNNKVEISKIGDVVRGLAELRIAEESSAEVIVLDGSLDVKFEKEKEYLDRLNEKCILCGLSKKSELDGFNFNKEGTWYYETDYPNVYFAKLHEKTRYVFRFDGDPAVLWLLKENAKDPVFLGYPYGLVEVHKLVKINKKEKEFLLTKIMAMAGEKWKKIEKMLGNAHDVLDKIC